MSYFLSEKKLKTGISTELSGDESRHMLGSRRMKAGEKFEIQDTGGKRYLAEIKKIGKNSLELLPLKELSVPKELAIAITLFQSIVSEKALDIIFQKATELGAAGITLFNSQNTATKLSADLFKKKYDRWNKILWEAAKQSGRGKIPALKFLPDLPAVISTGKEFYKIFVLDASGVPLNHGQSFQSYSIVIGPEGGFTPQEISQVQSVSQVQLISLSPFTLRAETAAIAATAVIMGNILTS